MLTDDNFATLVHAVDLGRDIYRRITSYVKLQLTILSSVLQLMLLATIFNINGGVALFPMQLLFCKFFVVVTVVIGFIADVPDPSVMQRPPRKPGTRIVTRPQIVRWVDQRLRRRGQRARGARRGAPTSRARRMPSMSMTMAFAIVALSAVNLGLVMRREREPVWSSPVFPYLGLDHPRVDPHLGRRRARACSSACSTPSRSPAGNGWSCSLLSLIAPAFVGIDKTIQLARLRKREAKGSLVAESGSG